jgi:hypothetical protein
VKGSELTPEAARRRTAVVAALRTAGWRCDQWEEMFAEGFSLDPEAYCEIPDDERQIGIGYHAEADRLAIKLEASDGERVVLRLYAERDPGVLAAALADGVQRLMSGDDVKHLAALVEQLRPLCRRMELETEDEILEID